MQSDTLPYLIVAIKNELFAINASAVAGILQMPKWIKIPMLPDYIRGAFNFRGKIIHIIDMRVKFGYNSAYAETQEMVELLNAREQDHLKWITELENCVHEGKEFKLARDPHKCAFGKWYYSYTTDNRTLKWILEGFELPHARIHAIADEVLNFAEAGNKAKANEIIEYSKITYLKSLLQSFENAKRAFVDAEKELLVVVEHEGKQIGLCVDKVNAVEYLDEKSIEQISTVAAIGNTSLFNKTARRAGNEEIIFIMETPALFNEEILDADNLLKDHQLEIQ